MVPNGWQKGLISDLVDTVMGYAFKSDDFVKEGLPLVRMGNLYQNQFQLDRSPIYLPANFATEYRRFLIQSGDLVMSMTGTMGKRDYGFAVEVPENTQDCLLNQRVLKVEPKSVEAKGFVLNLLKSEHFLSRLYSLPGGTKQANLSATQIIEIPVLIPPLQEQQKIAKIISTWDKAISTTERLIGNSTQQKKALMQQLLTGKKRLLDDEEKQFEGEWVKGLFSDLADTVMGYAFKSNDFIKEGIPLVRMGNLYQNQFQLDRSPIYLPDDFVTEYKRFLLQSGDLVMSMTGTMGKRDYGFAVEIPENTQVCLLNQRVLKIEPRNSDAKGFVLNILKSEIFLSKLYSLPGGTKQANLSATQIREISVLIPPLPEQQKIATVLTNADKKIELLEQQLADLQQEKKALMQVLLTGKKRVRVDFA